MVGPAARSDDLRRHNLGAVLAEIHLDGELSRAELTHRLGLNRSTIGGLVSELVEMGLVTENVPVGNDRAGRPSHLVAPRSDGPYAIAADVDVDRVACAAVSLGGRILARRETAIDLSKRRPDDVVELIISAYDEFAAALEEGSWPVGMGVSIPGTVHSSDQRISFAPNLNWANVQFGQMISDRLGIDLSIKVGNDADLGVLAEHLRGAARDCDDTVYLTGRIGVGGGLVVGGRPVHGTSGLAGEIGHVVLDPAGPECHCGNRGCVEMYIGEAAALRIAGRDEPASAENIAELAASARRGEEPALFTVLTVAESLGRTIANLVNLLNPRLIVLGGWLDAVLSIAGAEVLASVKSNTMPGIREEVTLVGAGLGRDSSLLGAAELAFQDLLADPSADRRAATAAQAHTH